MAAPRPSAGPLTAATMGFLNWMKVSTKVLRGGGDAGQRSAQPIHPNDARQWPVPDGFRHLDALLLPVLRQAADEVEEVEAAAEHAADGAQQNHLAVI